MARGTRYRTRFSVLDIPSQTGPTEAVVGVRFNKTQHRRHHGPSMLLYSQTATLADGLVGSFIYMPFACKVLTFKGIVQTAPAADFVFDVLEDSLTIFHTSPAPRILAGETEGQEYRPDRRSFQRGTKLYITVTTASTATKPFHVVACVEPGYHN